MNGKFSYRACAAATLLIVGTAFADGTCGDVTVLTDAAGDWSGDLANIAGVPGKGTPEQDLLALSLSQPDANLHFKLKLGGAPVAPLPNASWFISFETPDAGIYGVRMDVDPTGTASFYSYVPAPSNGGGIDGRFVGAKKAAEAGSGLHGDSIEIVVKPENIGVLQPLAGQLLGPFNAASMQGVGAPQTGNVLAFTVDNMPDTLSRDGVYALCAGGDAGKSGSGFVAGALTPLSLGTLGWFAFLVSLRRARRPGA